MSGIGVDAAVIIAYVIIVLVIGLRQAKARKTSEEYYLAGRSMRWPFVAAALFSTNISAEHYVGYAGGAYGKGIVVGATEMIAAVNLIFLAVLFLPFYLRLKVFTVPEFLERRFNLACRIILSVSSVVSNIVTRLSVALWGCALIMKNIMGWDPVTTVWLMGTITTIYTLAGGLAAVMYTESFQAVVMLGSGIILTLLSLHRVGGWDGLVHQLSAMNMGGHLHWAKSIHDPELPWTSFTLPWLIIASFYWCMDQTIVQRALSARSLNEARKGAVFTGFIKLIHMFIFVVPGMCALVLFPGLNKPDDAYATMITRVLPMGLRGLALASVMAALMSTLAGALNSTATLIVGDFVKRFRPETSERRQIAIGWVAIVVVALLGMLWAPFIARFESLWTYLMRISIYIQAPISGVFFLGLLWRKANARGAVIGILVGVLLGITAFLNDLGVFAPRVLNPVLNHWLLKPFPHRGLLIVLLAAGITALVSALKKQEVPPSADELSVDWKHPRLFEAEPGPLWADWRLWLVGLLAVDVFLYVRLM